MIHYAPKPILIIKAPILEMLCWCPKNGLCLWRHSTRNARSATSSTAKGTRWDNVFSYPMHSETVMFKLRHLCARAVRSEAMSSQLVACLASGVSFGSKREDLLRCTSLNPKPYSLNPKDTCLQTQDSLSPFEEKAPHVTF